MTILHPAPISMRQFSYDPSTRTFTGEISSTHGFGRVYDDACDEGLTLVSAKTGREVVFVVERTEYRDGEIVSWTLKPADSAVWAAGSILLFND